MTVCGGVLRRGMMGVAIAGILAACTQSRQSTVSAPRPANPPPRQMAQQPYYQQPYGQSAPQSAPAPHRSTLTIERLLARNNQAASPRHINDGEQVPKGGGQYKLGQPYSIGSRWYVPMEDPNYDKAGAASWYGPDFHGRKTANGEIYDMHALTAAHPTLPLPSLVHVTSVVTGRTVLVRVNDRGPYAHNRIIDLSKRTADLLGIAHLGVSEVRVRYAGRAPLNGDDSHERRFLAGQPWAVHAATPRTQNPPLSGRSGLFNSN